MIYRDFPAPPSVPDEHCGLDELPCYCDETSTRNCPQHHLALDAFGVCDECERVVDGPDAEREALIEAVRNDTEYTMPPCWERRDK